MSTSFQQKETGSMTYPTNGTLNRFLFKLPVIWWRMGLGSIQGHWQLVLTTWGRKSKLPCHTMLTYTAYQGKAYIISGWNERSDWYQNILANSVVTVQSSLGTYSAFARRVSDIDEYRAVMEPIFQTGGDSHFRPWLQSLDIAHDLGDVIAKRERVFLIALDPTPEAGPPAMPADLKWVWGAMAVSFVIGWLLGRYAAQESRSVT